MRTLVVTFDFVVTREDSLSYDRLIEQIGSYPHSAKVLHSAWLIRTTNGARTVRDDLRRLLDPNDRVFVGVLQREVAAHNHLCPEAWLDPGPHAAR